MRTDKLASTTLAKEAAKEHVGSPRILGLLFDVDGTLYHQGLLHAMMAACFAAAFLRRPQRWSWRSAPPLADHPLASRLRRHWKLAGGIAPQAKQRLPPPK